MVVVPQDTVEGQVAVVVIAGARAANLGVLVERVGRIAGRATVGQLDAGAVAGGVEDVTRFVGPGAGRRVGVGRLVNRALLLEFEANELCLDSKSVRTRETALPPTKLVGTTCANWLARTSSHSIPVVRTLHWLACAVHFFFETHHFMWVSALPQIPPIAADCSSCDKSLGTFSNSS